MSTLSGKTLFITGASRGIGLARLAFHARQPASPSWPSPACPIPSCPAPSTVAAEVEAGGRALPISHIRGDKVREAVAATVAEFGGLDICRNASAIWLKAR